MLQLAQASISKTRGATLPALSRCLPALPGYYVHEDRPQLSTGHLKRGLSGLEGRIRLSGALPRLNSRTVHSQPHSATWIICTALPRTGNPGGQLQPLIEARGNRGRETVRENRASQSQTVRPQESQLFPRGCFSRMWNLVGAQNSH